MDNKFNRNYILTIQKIDDSFLVVKPPFTVEFDITKNNLGSANSGNFRIYNLSQLNRSSVRFDLGATNTFRRVTFQAGYNDQLSTIFDGNVSQAWSAREGNNFITEVSALDGGFAIANAQTDQVFQKGTPNTSVIASIMNDLKPTVQPGAVGSFPGTLPRGSSQNGDTAGLLEQLTGRGFSIDNGKAYALNDDEYIQGQVDIIDAKSGLLGTPLLQTTLVVVEMLFEPRLFMYQKIQLKSLTADADFNRAYKVIGLHHRGLISAAVCGDATSTVSLSSGIASPVNRV